MCSIFDNKNNKIYIGLSKGNIIRFSYNNNKIIYEYKVKVHDNSIYSLCLINDKLITCSRGYDIKILNTKDLTIYKVITSQYKYNKYSIYNIDNNKFIIANGGYIEIYDINQDTFYLTYKVQSRIIYKIMNLNKIEVNNDMINGKFVSCSGDKSINIWKIDRNKFKSLKIIKLPSPNDILYFNDLLSAYCYDGKIYSIDINNYNIIYESAYFRGFLFPKKVINMNSIVLIPN